MRANDDGLVEGKTNDGGVRIDAVDLGDDACRFLHDREKIIVRFVNDENIALVEAFQSLFGRTRNKQMTVRGKIVDDRFAAAKNIADKMDFHQIGST